MNHFFEQRPKACIHGHSKVNRTQSLIQIATIKMDLHFFEPLITLSKETTEISEKHCFVDNHHITTNSTNKSEKSKQSHKIKYQTTSSKSR